MPDIPKVNTDEWADYMIETITNGGKIRDEDTAAMMGVQTKQVRRVVIALVTSFNGDDGSGGGGGVTKDYVDRHDNAVSDEAASADADLMAELKAADNATLAAAKKYTDDQRPADGVSPAYVDEGDLSAIDTANAYTDNAAAMTLDAAKAYADQSGGGSSGATTDYVDDAVRGALTAAGNYTDTESAEARADAASYTDDAIDTLATGVASMIDAKLPDTGWNVIQPISGWQGNSVVQVRRDRSRVTLRGQLAKDDSSALAALAGVLTLPEGYRPSRAMGYVGLGTASQTIGIAVNTTGVVNIAAPSAASTLVKLDSVVFYTD